MATATSIEEIEGLGPPSDDLGEYPIDSLLIRQEQRSVFEIIRRMNPNLDSGKFILDPDFQRDFVWDLDKQSKLIESSLMRIPLPVFYLAEREDGNVVVVDGLQRLSTFRDFLMDKFSLRGLNHATQLNGSHFSELSPKLKNRIEDTQLILYLIDNKVPEQAKLDIFERVNSGEPLTRQQMRNSIYCGPGTLWLRDAARGEDFRRATGGSIRSETMRDREVINRFCGFYVFGRSSYRGDIDLLLAETLRHMNRMSQESLAALRATFDRSMRNNLAVFERHAFRKHTEHSTNRSVINVALFDVFSVLFARVSEERVAKQPEAIRSRFFDLMGNDHFVNAITYSTNSTRQVNTRFEMTEQAMHEFLDHVDAPSS
jgi:uncharacterized protein DUF262